MLNLYHSLQQRCTGLRAMLLEASQFTKFYKTIYTGRT
jgi:hypothetical protein